MAAVKETLKNLFGHESGVKEHQWRNIYFVFYETKNLSKTVGLIPTLQN